MKIEEEDKALLLLASLHVSYYHIVTTLLFGKDTLRYNEVIVALLLNESRRKSFNDSLSGRVVPWFQLMFEVDQLGGKQVLVSTSGVSSPKITNCLTVGIVIMRVI